MTKTNDEDAPVRRVRVTVEEMRLRQRHESGLEPGRGDALAVEAVVNPGPIGVLGYYWHYNDTRDPDGD